MNKAKKRVRNRIIAFNRGILVVMLFIVIGISIAFVESVIIQRNVSDTIVTDIHFEEVEVHRIIDGDTIDVLMSNGDVERVRFIGVDAPERGEVGFDEATNFVANLIPRGTIIWLESVGNDRDRFGRLRRYIWIELPSGEVVNENISQLRQRMTVNGLLLNYGYAVVWP